MKKLFAVLTLISLLAFSFAFAEEVTLNSTVIAEEDTELAETYNAEAGQAIITSIIVPEGYIIQQETDSVEATMVHFIPCDAGSVRYDLGICYSELFGDYTLNDLTEEEFSEMSATLTADYNNAAVSERATEVGTKLILIDEQDSDSDYAALVTVYHGYFIEVSMFSEAGVISEADIQRGVDILSGLSVSVR